MSRPGFNRQLPRDEINSTREIMANYLDNRAYDIIGRTLKRARTI
jgi:hypothetical protein